MSHNKALDNLTREQLVELLESGFSPLKNGGVWKRPCTTM